MGNALKSFVCLFSLRAVIWEDKSKMSRKAFVCANKRKNVSQEMFPWEETEIPELRTLSRTYRVAHRSGNPARVVRFDILQV